MIQRISKRFLSLLLVAVMVLALAPAITLPAFAATSGTVTGLSDSNIGLGFTGTADNAWSASGTQIIGKARSTSGSCGGSSNYRSTLTITNNKTTKATLSFDYTVVVSDGTILVNNITTTTAGSFSKELAAGGTVEVEIESGSTSADTKITMTNVKLVADVSATVTFQPAENGSYTVDGKTITEVYTHTQSSMTAYQVAATPAEGYRFKGWYDVASGKCISTDAKTALNFDSNRTITARFVSKELALFETGGQIFDDLNEAIAEAQKNLPATITLAESGKITGNYTIPSKVTLLIPFDEAKTCYTSTPTAITSAPAATPFRTLTMAAGSSLTLANGAAISIGGQYYAASGGQQGRIVGPYGYIKMESGSAIDVQSGASLYAWGFISGSGAVTVESGGSVYEWYQILDFRGGSASSEMGNSVFPFSQYAVQNVEVPLTLHAGASETVYTAVYAMRKINPTSIPFIGDKGMFKLTSGSFTKDYDEKTDRLVFTVNGEAALNTLSLKLAGQSVNSASYVLPITNNITINIQSGNVTINQDAALLAGVEVNIAEGAGLTVANGKNIYFYDSDEWNSDNFVWGPCKFKSVAYAPGKAYNRTNNDLVDAKMDVNGSVTAIGAIYTTEGGADICSSNGTGKYIQQGTPGTETETYQYNANGNKAVTIPITAAKLHNAGDSYTGTAGSKAGDTYVYANGKWALRGNEITITFDPNGGAGSMEPMSVNPGVGNKLIDNTFTRENYTFTGWNTAKDGTGKTYADGETVNFSADTTLYAQWTQNPVITFDANGGKWELEPGKPIKRYVPVPANSNRIDAPYPPVREGYTFLGWYDNAENFSEKPINFKIRPFDRAETVYAHWAKNATVTLKIVNGYWSDNTAKDKTVTVVLHPQANGSASGTLRVSDVPAIMIPAAGYENTPGHWDVTPNTEENGISGDVTYTYIFGKKHHSSSSKDENKDKDNNKENNKENNKDNNTGETTPTKVPDLLNGSNHFAYVVGYKDGNVRPQGNITRAETAAIFFRLLKEEVRSENLSKHNDFADVTEDSWYNTAVSTMAGMNILKGRTANSFVPQAPITRAEFAAICARFDSGKAEENNSFTDISGHWAEKEIERAATLGWVSGYTDGSFHPDAPITRAEAMTLINRVLCRMPETKADLLDSMTKWPDNQPGAWYYLAVQEATNSHTYEQKDSKYETWTALTAEPDWSKY